MADRLTDGHDGLVDALWEGALADDLRPFTMALGHQLGAECASLVHHDFAGNQGRLLAGYGVDAHMQRLYEEHYCHVNVWISRQESLPAGGLVRSDDLLPLKTLRQTEYYADWLRPQGLVHALGSVIERRGTVVTKLGVLRGHRRGPMRDEELQAVSRLLPHLRQALRVGAQVRAGALAREALQANPYGLVQLDRHLVVHELNSAAARIFEAGDGLRLGRNRGLHAGPGPTQALRALLERTMAGARPPPQDCRLRVPRPSGLPDYVLELAPAADSVRRFAQSLTRGARALLTIVDPARALFTQPEQAMERLRWQFGFTPAEARLAVQLANGRTLAEAAGQLDITEGTARFMSKRLFAKTGTNSQARLVALLLKTKLE